MFTKWIYHFLFRSWIKGQMHCSQCLVWYKFLKKKYMKEKSTSKKRVRIGFKKGLLSKTIRTSWLNNGQFLFSIHPPGPDLKDSYVWSCFSHSNVLSLLLSAWLCRWYGVGVWGTDRVTGKCLTLPLSVCYWLTCKR